MRCKNSHGYWDGVIKDSRAGDDDNLWRLHLKSVYRRLWSQWVQDKKDLCILKTDLYDEALSNHNFFSLVENPCDRITGVDISFEVAKRAKERFKDNKRRYAFAVCDIQTAAFKSDSFNIIISLSTLDHFPKKEQIIASIKELHKILRPKGVFIVTLDNLSNPIVFLRNLLPFGLLKFFGLVDYHMGKTLSRRGLVEALVSCGFEVSETRFIDHSLRIVVVFLSRVLSRRGMRPVKSFLAKSLLVSEKLERTPLASLTGNFVAVKAVKR